ncbi:5-oxoprolinase subunit PxpA [Parvularcula sp. ZS-1/3]|uniref:5-oxoprolinase subunit PxpA n=1 Tax=Parvularcula mediterranea TaxID=2732508 RepID=A0A7Y3W3H8_9PROT|nr:5-oxoprolinase subunit PxpA [Parvularcula mediterranea]NNU14765.1 5-oxoprolinase subunit PxpA [Parvularcula mediterranea]
MKIDLNADLGEGMPSDAAMMPYLSSCNIACGGHAGDEASMRAALRLAKAHGVSAGAHPSYPDHEHFGRKSMAMEAEELTRTLREQIDLLLALAKEEGVALTHVKPHGALYNDAAKDRTIADAVVAAVPEGLALVGLAGSAMKEAAKVRGLAFIREGFVDRRYTDEGFLQPRAEAGSVLDDADARIEQAVALARGDAVKTASGGGLVISAQTLCLHGDTPGAAEAARAIHEALTRAGFAIGSPYA